jgi:hypothetical protein
MVKVSKTSSAFQFCYFSKNTKLLLSDKNRLIKVMFKGDEK